jgi:hypothetical protein
MSAEGVQPLFVFSLPRSGSTMLQRILAAHPAIASAAEPWILLPYLYSLRDTGIRADYGQYWMVKAVRDFVDELPGGEQAYWAEVRELVLRLYTRAAKDGERYFLDKTPPYHHVVDEVIQLFPQGRFVFLWRNPLAITASVMETWAGGRWNLDIYGDHLWNGLDRLLAARQRHADRSLSLRYEDLVQRPEDELTRVFRYLDLSFNPDVLERFPSVIFPGHLGDATGVRRYRTLSTESIDRWRETLRNPLRKRWARRYLEFIGRDRLALMGYDIDQLLVELRTVRGTPRLMLSDGVRHTYGLAYSKAKDRVLNARVRRLDARPGPAGPTP